MQTQITDRVKVMFQDSTIAAVATGLTDSGIGIIRISGPEAVSIGDNLFRNASGKPCLKDSESHKMRYGFAVDKNGVVLDEVMAVVMKRPRSFTGEDTVEIQCHGGVLVMRKILEASFQFGARLAEPGEFTKRAFLNGKMDLSEAEAVMDVIRSGNEYALASSVDQLRGNLSEAVKAIRKEILSEIAFIEAALDDPEHISLEGYSARLSLKTENLLGRVKKLLDTADSGRLMKEGISTVILGKPNVGKSSLLNLLLGEDRAIVTDVAGTTRDILEEHINLHGIGFNIVDTAGIRETDNIVEQIGVDRAKQYADKADLILYVADCSVPLEDKDREIMSLLKNKNAVILLNKSDLQNVVTEEEMNKMIKDIFPERTIPVIGISAKEGTGIEEFENVVRNLFFEGELTHHHEIVITNLRHKEALQNSYDSLMMVKNSIDNGMEEDFYSIDLTSAYQELGKIIGEEVDDDVVEEIFSKFCIGK